MIKRCKLLDSNLTFGLLCVLLTAVIITSIIISIALGAVNINPSWIWMILCNKIFNCHFEVIWPKCSETIIWQLRFPRVLLSAIVGAGLSLAGVMMQALTRNSLADPYILGISSGASTGAVCAVLLGAFDFMGQYGISGGAFIGALLSTYMVFRIASYRGRCTSTTLVLTGVAIDAVFASITSFIVFQCKDVRKLYSAMFWMAGSFAGSQWQYIYIGLGALIVSVIISMLINRALDAILLGEDTASTIGVNIKLLRIIIIIVSTLLTGLMVSLSGIIGFVGLIIPHISRPMAGSSHKKLIPLSLLLGAIFLIWADVFARMIGSPEELPIGVVTSFLGAPFFLWLLKKSSYSFGGRE